MSDASRPSVSPEPVRSSTAPRPQPPPLPGIGYAGPGAPSATPAAPPDDTDLGWRLASWLLIFDAVLRLLSFAIQMASQSMLNDAAGAYDRRAPSGLHPLYIAGVLVGVTVSLVAAFGLRNRQVWAKWLALVLVIIGGLLLISVAAMVNRRDLPLNSQLPLIFGALWMIAGYYILLDRPTNPTKVYVGFGMTCLWYLVVLIFTLGQSAGG